MSNVEQPAPATAEQAAVSPWMSMEDAAAYSGRHYQTVYEACRRYSDGDRTSKALKNFQEAPGCKRDLLRSDVERWMRKLPPSRATRVA